jgi:hypothetical protein
MSLERNSAAVALAGVRGPPIYEELTSAAIVNVQYVLRKS